MFDVKKVYIKSGSGPFTEIAQISSNPGVWQKETIDISSYAGNTVNIMFLFDTVNGNNNNYEGWFVDDITIAES